jgi:hypothetical protein
VLWVLACRYGVATARMRDLMYKSLVRNTPAEPQTADAHWAKEAGKVICFSRPNIPRLKSFLGYHTPRSAQRTTWAASNTAERLEQRALANAILRRDLLACRRVPVRDDWLPMLEAAVKRDQHWARWNVLTARPLMWKQQFVVRLGDPHLSRQTGFRAMSKLDVRRPLQLEVPVPRSRARRRGTMPSKKARTSRP